VEARVGRLASTEDRTQTDQWTLADFSGVVGVGELIAILCGSRSIPSYIAFTEVDRRTRVRLARPRSHSRNIGLRSEGNAPCHIHQGGIRPE
jgi:hypothetical protein